MNRCNKYLLIIVCFLIITVIVGFITLEVKRTKNDYIEISISDVAIVPKIGEIAIDGAVTCPGVYYFTGEDTIQSILIDAGIKKDAASNNIKIHIPYKEPQQDFQRININRAETWLLEALPGIGPSKAQAIVEYRTVNGHFNCIEDILLVDGFGEATFNKISDLINVFD